VGKIEKKNITDCEKLILVIKSGKLMKILFFTTF